MLAHRQARPTLATVVGIALLTACSATAVPGSSPATGSTPPITAPSPSASTTTAVPTPSASAAAIRTPPPGLTWRSTGAIAVATLPSGAQSLLWMDPARLTFRFVPGTQFPEGSPAAAADSTPATWVPRMVAAFNGGFKLRDHVGGYYYLGHTVSPLRAGYASLVIRRDGSITVGSWGTDVRMSPDVVVVRQNLTPLIERGRSLAKPTDSPAAWGRANGGLPVANRSALAVLGDGSLVFEYGHDVTAAAMANSLVAVGAVQAMMLDMNKSWPIGYTYSPNASAASGVAINGHVARPASTYLTRFRKDFVAVETR